MSPSFSPRDTAHMQHALRLANRALGNCWPNPAVGAVIVKDGNIIGTGWTQAGGRPHAETEALTQAGEQAKGATLYVTLEPCAHTGQTPPCTEAIIDAGITRVVIACTDPNAKVNGKGIEQLTQANIHVETSLLEAEAKQLNAGFFSCIEKKRPYVTLKLATSLDGKVALANGQSQWITDATARNHGHYLRATHDAILTGIGTVLADDPELTCRLPGLEHRSPVRVVLDSDLQFPENAKLLEKAKDFPVWIFPAKKGNIQNAKLFAVSQSDTGLNLEDVLTTLVGQGITRLLVEAGGTLSTAFIQQKLADEIVWYHGNVILGHDAQPAIGALHHSTLAECPTFNTPSTTRRLACSRA